MKAPLLLFVLGIVAAFFINCGPKKAIQAGEDISQEGFMVFDREGNSRIRNSFLVVD